MSGPEYYRHRPGICCICEKPFVRSHVALPMSLIYCSVACAQHTSPGSPRDHSEKGRALLHREMTAIEWAMAEQNFQEERAAKASLTATDNPLIILSRA